MKQLISLIPNRAFLNSFHARFCISFSMKIKSMHVRLWPASPLSTTHPGPFKFLWAQDLKLLCSTIPHVCVVCVLQEDCWGQHVALEVHLEPLALGLLVSRQPVVAMIFRVPWVPLQCENIFGRKSFTKASITISHYFRQLTTWLFHNFCKNPLTAFDFSQPSFYHLGHS